MRWRDACNETPVKKIEAIVKPFRVEQMQEELRAAGVLGMTVSEVRGYGRNESHTELHRCSEYTVDFVPRIKVEVVVSDDLAEAAIAAMIRAAKTGKAGDGKIFVSTMSEALRIRTAETGNPAL
jgi:nitrogen regulatory protein P-II 1